MINIPLSPGIKDGIVKQTINEILRRSVDTTSLPIFVDQNLRINIGATSGAIHSFFVSLVADFNKQAFFFDNIAAQRNICISGDGVVSGLFSAGNILTRGARFGDKGITFQDGTQQTTALASSSGGSMSLVSTQNPSASSGVTFSNLSPGIFYQIRANLKQGTAAGFLRVQFNGDAGANYNCSQSGTRNDGSAATTGNVSGTFIILENEPNTGPQSGHQHLFNIDFNTLNGDGTKAGIYFSGRYTADTTTYWNTLGAGQYSGASNLASIKVFPSAGDITGTISLYKINTA